MHMTIDATEISVSLTVNNLSKSTEWYTTILGFEVTQRHERNEKLMAVSLKSGSVRILLTQDDGAKGADRAKGDGFSMQLITPHDIDALAAHAKEHGVTLATEPATMPWGKRMFRLQDPDGFRYTISS
jgi:uncharacterized glyoxalase superfamily protein PhnB